MNGQKLKAGAFYENLKSRIVTGLLAPKASLGDGMYGGLWDQPIQCQKGFGPP